MNIKLTRRPGYHAWHNGQDILSTAYLAATVDRDSHDRSEWVITLSAGRGGQHVYRVADVWTLRMARTILASVRDAYAARERDRGASEHQTSGVHSGQSSESPVRAR
jgi:hypothetical protein